MNTTDQVLLIILTTLLSLYTLLGIVAMVGVIKLISSVRRVAAKAENVVDTVEESATEILRDTEGKLAFFKLIRNIVKVVKKHNK